MIVCPSCGHEHPKCGYNTFKHRSSGVFEITDYEYRDRSQYSDSKHYILLCPKCGTIFANIRDIKNRFRDEILTTETIPEVIPEQPKEDKEMSKGILSQLIELAEKHNTLTTVGVAALVDQAVTNGVVRNAIKKAAGEAIGNLLGTVVGAASEAIAKSQEKE